MWTLSAVMVPDLDSRGVNKTIGNDGQEIKALYRSAPPASWSCGFCWHLILFFYSVSEGLIIKTVTLCRCRCVCVCVCVLKEETNEEDSTTLLSIFSHRIKSVGSCKRQLLRH